MLLTLFFKANPLTGIPDVGTPVQQKTLLASFFRNNQDKVVES
jgi:hypothetical protein